METIRLLCVEDDPLVRTYLATRLALEADIDVAGVVPSAGEALRFLGQESVDVVLLDYRLEGADGLQLLSAIESRSHAEHGSTPRVLFCTGVSDGAFDQEARARGAAGVLTKDQMPSDLLTAVRAVAGGREWFAPGANI
jgi:DNA-binding NarL/FixJ family response regulator